MPSACPACNWFEARRRTRYSAWKHNAVTLQSEMTLMAWRAQHGGELTRIHVAQAQPLGEFDTWRQALPITLLDVVKPL